MGSHMHGLAQTNSGGSHMCNIHSLAQVNKMPTSKGFIYLTKLFHIRTLWDAGYSSGYICSDGPKLLSS